MRDAQLLQYCEATAAAQHMLLLHNIRRPASTLGQLQGAVAATVWSSHSCEAWPQCKCIFTTNGCCWLHMRQVSVMQLRDKGLLLAIWEAA